MDTKTVAIASIALNESNPRTITDEKFSKLINSLLVFPEMLRLRPIVVDSRNVALGGNMRYRALTEIAGMTEEELCARLLADRKYQKLTGVEQNSLLEFWQRFRDDPRVEVVTADKLSSDEIGEFLVKDNASFGAWSYDDLSSQFDEADLLDWGVDVWQMDQEDDEADNGIGDGDSEKANGKLQETFIAPPFSVLDTKQGYWQDRKKTWLALGIKSEESRHDLMPGLATANKLQGNEMPLVSIFDPVLCEIAYQWFNVPHGKILDPFAGGSVRGIVAAKLGFPYLGNDLREEQILANRVNAMEVLPAGTVQPVWTVGDSQHIDQMAAGYEADMVFSCPPYGDLEVYSDDPADLSNMSYTEFMTLYRGIIQKSCAQLKNDRFAVFVVGDIRDKKGCYRNFVSDTISAFLDSGLSLYNEIILVTTVGSLAVRAGRQFNGGRKVGKQHQNVLVFYKGDPKHIKDNYPKIEYDPEYLESLGMDQEAETD